MVVTIDDVLDSLQLRAFYSPDDLDNWIENAQTQVDAVLEELAEVARDLRRHRQSVSVASYYVVATEAADVVVSAVCLLGVIVGPDASSIIRAKMSADELRGYRHSGVK